MPDVATLGVLKDVISITILALILGAGVYAITRLASPVAAWNHAGKVISQPYEWPDALVAGLLVMLLMMLSGLIGGAAAGSDSATTGSLDPHASEAAQLTGLMSSIVMELVVASLVIGFLSVLRGSLPVELFGLRRMTAGWAFLTAWMWMVPVIILIPAAMFISAALLKDVWPDLGNQSAVELLEGTQSPAVKIVMTFTAVVVAPLYEELLFRGFLFGVFKRYTDSYFAALISALLFAAIHVHVGNFIPLFILGLIFAAAYEITGCLLVTMFMHAIFNAVEVTFMLTGAA